MSHYFRVLTIAGSDSGGGAGIQADIKTISALGCYGLSVITALTAQNTQGVTAIHEVPVDVIEAQLDAVLSDISADAVKIGMLFSPEIVQVVAKKLSEYKIKNIVLDPVMIAKGGAKLLQNEAVQAIAEQLLPKVTLVTPNVLEASLFADATIAEEADMPKVAELILESGVPNVLIKGGHLSGPDSSDFLMSKTGDGLFSRWFKAERIDTNNTHGTGCTLSSAIASGLAKGLDLVPAIESAKRYLTGAIDAGKGRELGSGHAPVMHFYSMWT